MEVCKVEIESNQKKKYLRRKDLAVRYSVTEQHIANLVKKGEFPPPMELHSVKLWPVELLDKIDEEKNIKYLNKLDKKWK